jgi:hypothetical protein
VHTFYEAVGYMIGAQTDQAVQEHLIEKYMLLPNQVWDSIIQQATKVSHTPLWDWVLITSVSKHFKLYGCNTINQMYLYSPSYIS